MSTWSFIVPQNSLGIDALVSATLSCRRSGNHMTDARHRAANFVKTQK